MPCDASVVHNSPYKAHFTIITAKRSLLHYILVITLMMGAKQKKHYNEIGIIMK